MKKHLSFYLTILMIVFTILSCSDSDDGGTPDNDGDPIGNPDPDPDPDPDSNPLPDKTTTYTADIKSIIDDSCIGCHANPPTNGAPMALITFQNVVDAVNNRNLFDRVSTTNSNNIMPPSGRFPDATITLIDDWIEDGLKEE